MFAYYSPNAQARRKSSNNNVSVPAISPPTSPYLSSMIEERTPPLTSSSHSGTATATGIGSGSNRGTTRKKSLLGSPFTSRFTTTTSPPKDKTHIKNAFSDSSHDPDHERERDILASGGSTMPLFTRDFALPPQDLDKNTRSYPPGNSNPNSSGVNVNANGRAGRGESSESFFPLYEYEYNGSSPVTSGPSGSNVLVSSPTFARPLSQSPVRRSIQLQSPNQSSRPVQIIPPGSVHDPYVSKYINPLGPPPTSTSGEEFRPGIVRSATEPHTPLLPTNTNGNGDGTDKEKEKDKDNEKGTITSAPTALATSIDNKGDNKNQQPIFEIFNAELDPSSGSEKSSELLRSHLEDVLKGQEHIGKMHLALENLSHNHNHDEKSGTGERDAGNGDNEQEQEQEESTRRDEEIVIDREKGVEEIMQRLDQLSETLRTYHQLGTPRLAFNQPLSSKDNGNGNGNGSGKTRSKSIAVDRPSTLEPVTPTNGSFPVPRNRKDNLSPPTIIANTDTSKSPRLRSPLSKTFHPSDDTNSNLRSMRERDEDTRGIKNNLDLDHSPSSMYKRGGNPRRKSLDVTTPPYQRWFDHSPPPQSHGQSSNIDASGVNEEMRDHWSRPNGGFRVRTISDSPIDMDDKSTF